MNPLKAWSLRRRLSSSDEVARREVVQQLAHEADPATIEFLSMAINDQSEMIAKEAIEAIAKFRTPEVLELLSAAARRLLVERTLPGAAKKFQWSSTRLDSLVLALKDFGPAAAAVWISVLQNRDIECAAAEVPYGRAASNAAELLGELQFAPAANALMARLADRDVQYSAIEALGRMKYSAAVGSLVSMLSTQDDSIRLQIFKALALLSWEPKDAAQAAEIAVLSGDLEAAIKVGAASIRFLLAEIWHCYETDKTPLDRLPQLGRVQSLIEAVEQIVERSGTTIERKDLEAIARLPDFRVQYMAEFNAYHEGTGNEYVNRRPSDMRYDCSKLRQRANEQLNRDNRSN